MAKRDIRNRDQLRKKTSARLN